MSEEEKQAYDYLEKYIEWETSGERNLEEDIKTILNLVNKQQKEIKARLEEIDSLYKMITAKDERIENLIEMVYNYNDMQYIRKIEELYISKDKIRHIRDKAECMDYYSLNDVIDDLTKLIGE